MNIQTLQRLVIDALEDVRPGHQSFQYSHITGMFDRVIIASGTSSRQTRAIAANVVNKIKEKKIPIIAVEGEDSADGDDRHC